MLGRHVLQLTPRVCGGVAVAVIMATFGAYALPAQPSRNTAEWAAAPPEWMRAIFAYTIDPKANGAVLLELGRGDTSGLPTLYLLALADAHQRAGHRSAAAGVLEEALKRGASGIFATWAYLALGWLSLQGSDYTAARGHFSHAAEGGMTAAARLGALMVAHVDAVEGRVGAAEALEELAVASEALTDLRAVAELDGAYARYWRGEYLEAANAFDLAAKSGLVEALEDDARYGAARSRWKAGDVAAARRALRELAGTERAGSRARAVPRKAAELEARALTAKIARRPRELPARPLSNLVVEIFDQDGVELAQAALWRLDEAPNSGAADDERPVPPAEMTPTPRATPAGGARSDADAAGPTTSRVSGDQHTSGFGMAHVVGLGLVAITAVVAGVAVRARRRQKR